MTAHTHRVVLPDDRVSVLGALDLDRTPTGLRPRRWPAWTRPRLRDDFLDLVVSMPAGVRLRLRTAARSLALDVHVTALDMPDDGRLPASFDLAVGGEVLARVPARAGDVLTFTDSPSVPAQRSSGAAEIVRFDDLPVGEKDVAIWLPHTAKVELRGVGSDAPLLPPTAPPGPSWIHHGSSISHGMQAPAPTLTWPVIAALSTGAALTDLGFAGGAVLDPEVARAIRDTPADLITLKIGINVVAGHAAMRERTFVPAVHGFLDTIREGRPHVPVVLASPIWCPALETVAGLAEFARSSGGSGPAHDPGALTISGIRERLTELVAVRADPALHYLDGRELLGPDETTALPDAVHPDAAAHLRMGDRAARLLVRPHLPHPDDVTRPAFAGDP